MKTLILVMIQLLFVVLLPAQANSTAGEKHHIVDLVAQYGEARASKDVETLKNILVSEVDQLVSTGEWRRGLDASLEGMMRSSTRQPGSRSLTVEEVRFLNTECAIADARYVIKNSDGSERKMWSTFVAVMEGNSWKIAAIRNMLPAK